MRRHTLGMTTDGLSYWQAESEGIELLDTTRGRSIPCPICKHGLSRRVCFQGKS
jgi:hypothetical protein